jgi:holo-[acyl-carrier protein] synthase
MIVGIGVDIVDIRRLRQVLERQGDRFVRRVFTLAEQKFCCAHRDPVPHYAARFAAKEAVFKALGTGWAEGVSWLDVEVRRQEGKAPTLALTGGGEMRGVALGVKTMHISLSHSDDAALAMVVLEK